MPGTGVSADDRAGLRYWDELWVGQELPAPIDPRARGWRNNVNRRLDALFRTAFDAHLPARGKLLEIGCGGSVMLPYFAKEHGFEVSGLDYSPEGCAKEEKILAREGVTGRIACADLFIPPRDMLESFDAVTSFGVVEHFTDTDTCIRAVAVFARRGGLVLTMIPNMRGLPGMIQKALNRKVYEAHVPLTPERLRDAHIRAGLTVAEARYVLSTNFGVVNLVGLDPKRLSTRLKRLTLQVLNLFSATIWTIERIVRRELPASRLLSPYVLVMARRAPAAK